MDELQIELLESQIKRLTDSIEARFQRLETNLNHHSTLDAEKLNQIKSELSSLKTAIKDHETRIRIVDDSVISNKITTTLMQAGQTALTLITAAIAAWLGSR